jgi:hypothetical protein
VEVDGQGGTSFGALSYAAPAVTLSLPTTLPTTGGSTLTILGNNFGVVDSTISVRAGMSSCVQVLWTSDSAMMCLVVPGTGGPRAVSARVALRSHKSIFASGNFYQR